MHFLANLMQIYISLPLRDSKTVEKDSSIDHVLTQKDLESPEQSPQHVPFHNSRPVPGIIRCGTQYHNPPPPSPCYQPQNDIQVNPIQTRD